jgi:hypothetical protein
MFMDMDIDMGTVVAHWAKAKGIHCYISGSIPSDNPRYCTNTKMVFGAQKIDMETWTCTCT